MNVPFKNCLNQKWFLIFVVALSLRVGYVTFVPQPEPVADAKGYDAMGWNLSHGYGISVVPGEHSSRRGPIYPIFLAVIYFVFGHNLLLVRILQALISALTVILIFSIAQQVFNKKIGEITAWLLALYPVLIVYCGLIITETLFTFCLAATILISLKAIEKKEWEWYIYSGLSLGITTLCRPTTVLFPIAILLVTLIVYAQKQKAVIHSIVMIIAFLIALSPWTVRNYIFFKTVFIVHSGGFGDLLCGSARFASENKDDYDKWNQYLYDLRAKHSESETEKILMAEGIKTIQKNFFKYVSWGIIKLPQLWVSSHSAVFGIDKPNGEYMQQKQYGVLFIKFLLLLLQIAILGLGITGIILSRKYWRNWLLPVLLILYFSMHVYLDPCPRHHLPVIPYLLMFAAFAVVRFSGKNNEIPLETGKAT